MRTQRFFCVLESETMTTSAFRGYVHLLPAPYTDAAVPSTPPPPQVLGESAAEAEKLFEGEPETALIAAILWAFEVCTGSSRPSAVCDTAVLYCRGTHRLTTWPDEAVLTHLSYVCFQIQPLYVPSLQ